MKNFSIDTITLDDGLIYHLNNKEYKITNLETFSQKLTALYELIHNQKQQLDALDNVSLSQAKKKYQSLIKDLWEDCFIEDITTAKNFEIVIENNSILYYKDNSLDYKSLTTISNEEEYYWLIVFLATFPVFKRHNVKIK